MSRRSEKLLLVLVVSLVTIFGTGLYAQENVGHIRGTVSDATGAVIPDVTVTLEHEATGVVKEVATNSAGAYAFIRLPLGEYSVRTRAEGFKSGERLLRIVSFVTQTVDFALEIGDVTETVSVTAQVLTVDTSSNVVGTTRDHRRNHRAAVAHEWIGPKRYGFSAYDARGDFLPNRCTNGPSLYIGRAAGRGRLPN